MPQQQLTTPQGWKNPFAFTMGPPSETFGRPRSFRHSHQNLPIPKSIFKKPVQLGRLRQAQQLKQRESNFSVARSLAAKSLEASHRGIRAVPGLTSAPLVSSRPTAVQHVPADFPCLQRFIMKKQLQQEQRAQHDSQTRTLASSGHNATSLSAPAAEHTERSSDEPAELGITGVPVAVWEDTPADHDFVLDSDDERLPALPSPTAVDAAPSAAAIMDTEASVADITVPDTVHAEVSAVEPTVAVSHSTGADSVLPHLAASTITAAEAVRNYVAAPITTAAETSHADLAAPTTTAAEATCTDLAAPTTTAAEASHADLAAPATTAAEASCADLAAPTTTAAETVPTNVAAGDLSSTDIQHADTARTTAAIDISAAAPLAVDMEAVLAQQRQQGQLRAAATAQASEADAAAGSNTGGQYHQYESSHNGNQRAADESSLTQGHMASAAVTGGDNHMQQPSGEHVGHGSAEPGKMGSEPSAILPGPLGQASPSMSLPFPLLPFSASPASHGPSAFVPISAAAIAASVAAKQKALADKTRRSQRAAQKAAQKAAEEAAALQRVLGGKQT